MNFYVIGVIGAVLIFLGTRRIPMLAWVAIWLLAVYCFVRFGISTLVPLSVLKLYLSLTSFGLLAYIFCDTARSQEVSGQLKTFIVDARYAVPLYAMTILLPIGLATAVYFDHNVAVKAPDFGRTVHPAPPNEITFKGKKLDLLHDKNPFRELETKKPDEFAAHVHNGSRVYYQNCVFCHGDDLNGDGIFAHGLNPVPANLNSPTTIAMLQESYLFWRIAKGGPGLPEESGPWSSSMPAWEKFLNEDEIWDVILFLYHYTERKPRAEEEEEESR